MMEQRRVRFSSLGVLTREDLPLAVDVWLEDAVKSPWATKETMKIAGILTRYILEPEPSSLSLSSIEDMHHIPSEPARRALAMLSLFGLVSAYTTARGEVNAALRLSQLQMLRILEAKEALARLEASAEFSKTPETHWTPEDTEILATSIAAPAEGVARSASQQPPTGRTAHLLLSRMADAVRHEQARAAADAA